MLLYKSPFLFSYFHRIDPTNNLSPNCPLCKVAEHITVHLFNCPHLPTALDPDCLWSNLAEAAALLDRWTVALAGSSKPAPPEVEIMSGMKGDEVVLVVED